MGIKYTEICSRICRPRPPERGLWRRAGCRCTRSRICTGQLPPIMLDAVKRTADEVTAHAKIANKFGIKLFAAWTRSSSRKSQTPSASIGSEVTIANTDPSAFTMQLDTGWAAVLGFDTTEMFKKNLGRRPELWHVKDLGWNCSHMTPRDDGGRTQAGCRDLSRGAGPH